MSDKNKSDGSSLSKWREPNDWSDEYGNVVCDNCGYQNDLPTGGNETECVNCGSVIDTHSGIVLEYKHENFDDED